MSVTSFNTAGRAEPPKPPAGVAQRLTALSCELTNLNQKLAGHLIGLTGGEGAGLGSPAHSAPPSSTTALLSEIEDLVRACHLHCDNIGTAL